MKSALAKIKNFVSVKNVQEKLSERAELEYPIIIKAMKDDEYRKKLKSNPKDVLEEELSQLLKKPVKFPENFTINVVEETENTAYIVLPKIVNSVELLSASDLDRDSGVAHYCTTVTCKPGWSC